MNSSFSRLLLLLYLAFLFLAFKAGLIFDGKHSSLGAELLDKLPGGPRDLLFLGIMQQQVVVAGEVGIDLFQLCLSPIGRLPVL